jgi:hypothetical protein
MLNFCLSHCAQQLSFFLKGFSVFWGSNYIIVQILYTTNTTNNVYSLRRRPDELSSHDSSRTHRRRQTPHERPWRLSDLIAWMVDGGDLPTNGVTDGLDPLASFVEEKCHWDSLLWAKRDEVEWDGAGMTTDLGRVDPPCLVEAVAEISAARARSRPPRRTRTEERRRGRRVTTQPPSPPCPTVPTCLWPGTPRSTGPSNACLWASIGGVGSAEDMGSRRATSTRSTKHSRG